MHIDTGVPGWKDTNGSAESNRLVAYCNHQHLTYLVDSTQVAYTHFQVHVPSGILISHYGS